MKSDPTPRLDALLASDEPVGLIFRRGPSKLVQVILWNRESDKFKPGQWFKGRIFVDRSDLSPDGRHLIYFAMGGVAWAIPETGGTWTAISQVPSLKAIALWGQGDTWGGGGRFTSNRSYWLDADINTFTIRNTQELRRDSKRPAGTLEERNGWVAKGEIGDRRIEEKALPEGWILRRITRYPRVEYKLEQPEDECTLTFPTWEWAEWDRTRLVWAENGYLRAAKLGSHKLGTIRTLYDFNGMKPIRSEP